MKAIRNYAIESSEGKRYVMERRINGGVLYSDVLISPRDMLNRAYAAYILRYWRKSCLADIEAGRFPVR